MISAPLLIQLVYALAGLSAVQLAVIGVLLTAAGLVVGVIGVAVAAYFGRRSSTCRCFGK